MLSPSQSLMDFSPLSQLTNHQLEAVQHQATRMVLQFSNMTYIEMLNRYITRMIKKLKI